jgi:ABC-type sugar transport system, periplasmic component
VYEHGITICIEMKELNQKIRIKDIATLAGVSEGTVDRVLHQRGDVSEKSKLAVEKVLKEINYTPNLFARSLATKKQYRFVCLFPAFQPGEYWESVDKGFGLAASDYVHHNVHIDKKYFNQFDVNSFVSVANEALITEPDAVFIAPIFRNETIKFTAELSARGIPYSFIDSLIEELDFQTYYGQHSFNSGYIAAKLLLASLPDKSEILVIRTKRKGSVSNQTLARNKGFLHYIEEFQLQQKLKLVNVEFNNDDEETNRATLKEVFQNHTNIKAAITFNSKVYRLAIHLAAIQHADVRLIGYDLLEENVNYLKQGIISYLITQRPDKQAYCTVRDMCRYLIFKQEIRKINYVPVDILMKENIEDYMNFTE